MGSVQKKVKSHTTHALSSIHNETYKVLHGIADVFKQKSNLLKKFENILLSPALDFVEDKNSYKIEAEMLGLDETDIKLCIKLNFLIIHGENPFQTKTNTKIIFFERYPIVNVKDILHYRLQLI